MPEERKTFQLHSLGRVRRRTEGIFVEIDKPYRPALKQLGFFSHVTVLWWAEGNDTPEQRAKLRGTPPHLGRETGVFAMRAPYRPNPVMTTVCRIVSVDEEAGLLQINNLDAFDDTPVIDLKAYLPVSDRVREAHIPPWLEGWPEWWPEEGLGLDPG